MAYQEFLPTAAWLWHPAEPSSRRAYRRASVDPDAARIESSLGLTSDVLQHYLDRFAEIVGPLRHRPDIFRPLSLQGGRLVACELAAVPDDVPSWTDWLSDVEHIQTKSPAVCEALAASDRSFTVTGSGALAPRARTPWGAVGWSPWIGRRA